MTIWKNLEGTKYYISHTGKVRKWVHGKYLILKSYVCKQQGYVRIKLSTPEPKVYQMHYLVMVAHVGPRPEGYVINHKDGDKTNNHIKNLEYCTRTHNNRHAIATGLMPKRKLTHEQVLEIRASPRGCGSLGKMYGVNKKTIKAIRRNDIWIHTQLPGVPIPEISSKILRRGLSAGSASNPESLIK